MSNNTVINTSANEKVSRTFESLLIPILIIGILTPMYTVTTLVNGYHFELPHFNLFDWHGYNLMFVFFPYLTIWTFYGLNNRSKSFSENKKWFCFFLALILLEQIVILKAPQISILTASSLPLIALTYYFIFRSPPEASIKSNVLFGLNLITICILKIAFIYLVKQRSLLAQAGIIPLFTLGIILSGFIFKQNLGGNKVLNFTGPLLLALGFCLKAFGAAGIPALNITKASLHLCLNGGLTFILFVLLNSLMKPHWISKLILICIGMGALLRFFVPLISPASFYPSLHYSMGFWTLGVLLFLFRVIKVIFNK